LVFLARAGSGFALLMSVFCLSAADAQDWRIDPTYLHRDSTAAQERPSDLTTASCHYEPLFGIGDPDNPPATTDGDVLGSIARFGKVVIDANGSCTLVQYPQEDQIYVALDGAGTATYADQEVPLKTEDFLYLPVTLSHTLKNPYAAPFTVLIMGFHTQGYAAAPPSKQPLKANIEDVPIELVKGHPDSTHYRLQLGAAGGTRDKFDVGSVVTSLFLMEIDAAGTNHPHHHVNAEEIYFVLSGHGEIVAGSGTDGIEGRFPAKAGDTYFYRANATVGYYSAPGVRSRLLCVRSWHPGMASKGH
jgi:mannose-6-phosphate isomerase-like protein (cupin superfamily)